jgi:hypothetical protein
MGLWYGPDDDLYESWDGDRDDEEGLFEGDWTEEPHSGLKMLGAGAAAAAAVCAAFLVILVLCYPWIGPLTDLVKGLLLHNTR